MPPFIYRCPNTSLKVQGFVAEEVPEIVTKPIMDVLFNTRASWKKGL
jgi:hypothetical protein